jgi:4-hydroxybenzoate polyprenyltransferase
VEARLDIEMDASALRQSLDFLARLSRWHDYSTTKVPLIFAPLVYLLLKGQQAPIENYVLFACMVVFTALYLAFGYMINDYADREVDRKAGKVNVIGQLAQPIAWMLLLLTLFAGAFVLCSFYRQPLVDWSVILAYAAAAAYSLPPIRLKERGVLGLGTSAIAQRVCPTLVLFAIYDHWNGDTVVFLALYAVIGLRWILIHQILDEANDCNTGVRTFVSQRGHEASSALMYKVVFPLEVALGTAMITIVSAGALERVMLLALYWGEIVLRLALHQQKKVAFSLTQYEDIPLAVFYLWLLPVVSAISLSLRSPSLVGILVIIVFWQWTYLKSEGLRQLRLFPLLWQRAPQ